MQLSDEQQRIIETDFDIKIQAVAGSGKTTTLVAYACSRPLGSRILYLAFNKTVREEANQRFNTSKVNVDVETAHSLAFKSIVKGSNYRIKKGDYKVTEIVSLMQLDKRFDQIKAFKIANHIYKYVQYFCNSSAKKVEHLNYLDTITDKQTTKFVKAYQKDITYYTRLMLAWMNSAKIEIIHDFYLKKFQLSNPSLNYDYILFDEGQDASAAMLSVFMNQKAKKIIVGDKHQQIYSWRYAINSLQQVDFREFQLTRSFRFNNHLASLALSTLKLKEYFSNPLGFIIQGAGKSAKIIKNAVIARTNLGLLVEAINLVSRKPRIETIYFEGNLNSYLYSDGGASLYDILFLRKGKKHKINDPLIKSFRNEDDLKEYIEATDDIQLKMMNDIIQRYGEDIHKYISALKDKNVAREQKDNAEIIFSTVHKCKGLEYDKVRLAQDFISPDSIRKITERKDFAEADATRLNEEINLLYVAITRSKNKLEIAEKYVPNDYNSTPQIKVLSNERKEKSAISELNISSFTAEERSRNPKPLSSIQKNNEHNYINIMELKNMFLDGIPIPQMARHFKTTNSAVFKAIKKLGLDDYYN